MIEQLGYDKISNPAQVGGIETSILDNGPGKGTRIAWINTGSGLRYKVVIDRAMDIADAFYNQHSIGWISHTGITHPQPFSNKGVDWLKTFFGGLLTTCGLTHVGGPETDSSGERGLHDEISNIPATLESVIQPDPARGKMSMSITGIMKQTQTLGPNLEMRRTISGTIGKSTILLRDEITNCGNARAPHMILYHWNFGWPMADEGTRILWNGKWISREGEPNNKIFREGVDFRRCPAPLDSHSGRGEEAAFIDIAADASGKCQCGLYNEGLGLAVALRFYKNQLPWLVNWQHWAKSEYVTGLEPATHPTIGQTKARDTQQLIYIEPGETRKYELEFEVMQEPKLIATFLKHTSIAD